MDEVIKQKDAKNGGSDNAVEWRVLIVDKLAMRMISSCCKMHELSNERITSEFSVTCVYILRFMCAEFICS